MTDRVSVRVTGVEETQRGIDRVMDGIDPASGVMREAAATGAETIRTQLIAAAGSSPTPQAVLVAGALIAAVEGDGAAVKVDSGRTVGSGGGSAGDLLQGSEHGGRNFAARVSPAGYWIAPTIQREGDRAAREAYQKAVDDAIMAGGF